LPPITDGVSIPGGTGYDEMTTITDQGQAPSTGPAATPVSQPLPNVPEDLLLPGEEDQFDYGAPQGGYYQPETTQQGRSLPPAGSSSAYGPYTQPRQPVFMRHASRPHNPQPAASRPAAPAGQNGLFGPVGYDVE
jgi:hypothetical protein